MKNMLRSFLCLSLLLPTFSVKAETRSCQTSCNVSASSCDTSCNSSATCSVDNDCDNVSCKPHFIIRSQGEHRNRDYVGQAYLQNLIDKDDTNWVAAALVAYSQNFKRHELGEFFSPHAGSNSFTVGPDNTAGVDVRNTDLGLSPTFEGTLTLNPRIQNIIFEPSFYAGFDRWVEGLWAWFKLPVVNSRWALDCQECITDTGGASFAPGQMSLDGSAAPVTIHSITDAFSGQFTFGDKKVGLQAGRVLCCENNTTGLADLPLHLGYDFIREQGGTVGAYLRAVFPTGQEKNLRSIFNPQVGYGRWQIGAGLMGRFKLYDNDNDTTLNAYLDFYTTHIFSKRECRVFDLKANGCFSRYLLLKEFDNEGVLTGNLFNVADIFTVGVKSQFNWSLETLALLQLKHKAWAFDLGYNLWARDCETFNCKGLTQLCNPCNELSHCCDDEVSLNGNQYGIKGNTYANDPDTASLSTIAVAATPDVTQVFITELNFADMLDFNQGKAPRALTHKVFGQANYNFEDRNYPLFVGIGGEAEFSHGNKALHQWSVWAKAGIAYN
jgi:hypothetical protein